MRYDFKTRVADAHIDTVGIHGLLDNHIEWKQAEPKHDFFSQGDFAQFYQTTNVIVHWGMYLIDKGGAGFDISIHVESVEGDHQFEFLNDDKKDDVMKPFRIEGDSFSDWDVHELKYHNRGDESDEPIGEVYCRSIEIDFVDKIMHVYFG